MASCPDKKSKPAPGLGVTAEELGRIVNKAVKEELAALQKPASRATKSPQEAFGANVTTGPLGERPYSLLKAVAYAKGFIGSDGAKEEVQVGQKLRAYYDRHGFVSMADGPTLMIPHATKHIPMLDQEGESLVTEVRQKMCGDWKSQVDPEEMDFINKKVGGAYTKALGALQDTAGGVLVGFPTLGELIDLQRNMETFANAGATETTLPPNGRIQYPKLAGGSTAYWVGEAATIASSQVTTGYLDLVAKGLGILTYINNQLLKFNTISAEAMVRLDMARVGALAIDLAELQGTGGTQIAGLINYPTQTSWSTGNDKLIAYTVTSNLFQPGDAANMVELLPDPVQEPTAWIMRRDMWSKIINRRADAVTTGDGAGPFVFNIIRNASDRPEYALYGTKVVRSSQVSNTRSTNKTFVLVGFFPDWIRARSGVMEFLASNLSDVAMIQNQTILRGLQYVDAGPRHPASFVFADAISIA